MPCWWRSWARCAMLMRMASMRRWQVRRPVVVVVNVASSAVVTSMVRRRAWMWVRVVGIVQPGSLVVHDGGVRVTLVERGAVSAEGSLEH